MKEDNDITIHQLTGITAFLNGQEGLHEFEEDLMKDLQKHNKPTLVLDNLFENPERLKEITKCDNLAFSTTGLQADKLEKLIEAFEKMKYVPKVVIFGGERSVMVFLGLARELKKHGTRFYYYDDISGKDLYEIGWI